MPISKVRALTVADEIEAEKTILAQAGSCLKLSHGRVILTVLNIVDLPACVKLKLDN